jgi:hypothetical protein
MERFCNACAVSTTDKEARPEKRKIRMRDSFTQRADTILFCFTGFNFTYTIFNSLMQYGPFR